MKSFKAILEFHNIPIPKKHDLIFLKNCVSQYINTDNDDVLDTLNRLYIDSRYPGELGLLPDGKPSINDIDFFYNYAKVIYQKAATLIS